MVMGITQSLKGFVSSSPTASAMNCTAWNMLSNVYSVGGLTAIFVIFGTVALIAVVAVLVGTLKAFKGGNSHG